MTFFAQIQNAILIFINLQEYVKPKKSGARMTKLEVSYYLNPKYSMK
jgi:hypothetical protein